MVSEQPNYTTAPSTTLNPTNGGGDSYATAPSTTLNPNNGGGDTTYTTSSENSCHDELDSQFRQCSVRGTVDVVLTVYKRNNSLSNQLSDVLAQTLRPRHVWIVKNEDHVNARADLDEWRRENRGGNLLDVDIVDFTQNSRFHGRFHIAYALSSAEYVCDGLSPLFSQPRGLSIA